MPKRRIVAVLAAAIAALTFVSCGDEDEAPLRADTPSTSVAPSAEEGGATVNAASSPLGQILVDAQGRTLYVFTRDADGKSNCTGPCAETWPPVAGLGVPSAGDGVDETKLATITRDDGSMQATYAGSPLYLYIRDEKAGDTNGQGQGGVWFVIDPDGKPVTAAATSTTAAAPREY